MVTCMLIIILIYQYNIIGFKMSTTPFVKLGKNMVLICI